MSERSKTKRKTSRNNTKKTNKEKDSHSEDEEIVIQFSDNETMNDSLLTDALNEVPMKHNYVLVEFKIRENNIFYYVGKILTDR